jgi:PAS domain S-box-containing protein
MAEKASKEELEKKIHELRDENERIHHHQDIIRAILDAQTDFFILIDSTGMVKDANQAVANYLGVPHDEFMGTCIWDRFQPRISERWRAMTARVFSSRKPLRFEENENHIWYDVIIFPVFGKGPDPREIAILAHDITSHKQVADLLRFQRNLGITLSSSLGVRDLLSRVLDEVISIEGIDAGGIYIVNERSGDIELMVLKGLPDHLARPV